MKLGKKLLGSSFFDLWTVQDYYLFMKALHCFYMMVIA